MRKATHVPSPAGVSPAVGQASRPGWGWLVRAVGENLLYFGLFALLCLVLAITRLPIRPIYDPDSGTWRMVAGALPNLLPIVLAVPAIIYLNTAVHEGGHLLAALLAGCWIYRVRIGPLALTHTRGGPRLGLIRERTLGGDVLCFPRDEDHLLPRRPHWSAPVAAWRRQARAIRRSPTSRSA